MAEPGGIWLAIDTATDSAGLALHDGAAVRAELQWTSRRRHTRELAPALAGMLEGQGFAAGDLAGIAVAIGPGSYTGLRIGLALAKGLALGAGPPVLGVPTLDILAAGLSAPVAARTLPLWVVARAGRGRLLAAEYPADWAPLTNAAIAPSPSAAIHTLPALLAAARPPAWVAGELDAAARAALTEAGLTVLPPAACLRRAAWLAELGRLRHAAGGWPGLDALAPAYLEPAGGGGETASLEGRAGGGGGSSAVGDAGSEKAPQATEILAVEIRPMRVEDIPAVLDIEARALPRPWPPGALRHEIEANPQAAYFVARLRSEAGRVVGYAGLWMQVDEAHISMIAVDPTLQRRGVGEQLLLRLADHALAAGAERLTLEVRASNRAAQALYARYGFEVVGRRERYYSDNNEDALIMTTGPIREAAWRARRDAREGRLGLGAGAAV